MTQTRYICKRCGACCRWAGYVHITDAEANAIAEFLELEINEFLDCYTRLIENRSGLSLTERADQCCIFITADNQCQIQPVKPQQCRDFPEHWNFPGFQRLCSAAVQAAT